MIIAQRGKSCGSGFKRIGKYCVRSDIVETIKGEGYPTWLLGDFLTAIGEDEVEERRFLDLWSAKDALLTQFEEALQPVRQKLLAQGIVAKEVTSVEIPWQCPEGLLCNALKVFLTALGNVKRGMKTTRAAHMIYSLDLAFDIVKATERKFAEWAEGFYIHPGGDKPLWMNIYMLYDYAYWYGDKRHRKAVEKILENYAEDPCKHVAEKDDEDDKMEIKLYNADVVDVAEINACLHRLGVDNVRVLRGCAVVVDDSKRHQIYLCEIIKEGNEIVLAEQDVVVVLSDEDNYVPSGEFKILSTRERRLARQALLRLRRLVEKLEGIELEDENRIWNFLYSASKTMLEGYTLIRGHETIIDNPINLKWWGIPAAAPVGTTVKDLKRLHYMLDAFTVAIELLNQKKRIELPFKNIVLRIIAWHLGWPPIPLENLVIGGQNWSRIVDIVVNSSLDVLINALETKEVVVGKACGGLAFQEPSVGCVLGLWAGKAPCWRIGHSDRKDIDDASVNKLSIVDLLFNDLLIVKTGDGENEIYRGAVCPSDFYIDLAADAIFHFGDGKLKSVTLNLNYVASKRLLSLFGTDLRIDIRKSLPGPAREDRGAIIYIDGRPYGVSYFTYMVITSDNVEVRNVVPLRKTKEEERRLVSEWSEVFDILTKKPLPTPMPFIEDVINQFVKNLVEYAPISVIWRYLPDYVPNVDAETIKEIMSPGMLPIYRKIASILIKAGGYDI